jgi:hypothetical protein
MRGETATGNPPDQRLAAAPGRTVSPLRPLAAALLRMAELRRLKATDTDAGRPPERAVIEVVAVT